MSPRRDIRLGRLLAQLQSLDVRHNRPTIRRSDLRRVIRHRAVAVRDHMKEVSQRRALEPRRMEAPSLRVPALHNHPYPVAHTRVAWRAVNVVTLLSTLQHL